MNDRSTALVPCLPAPAILSAHQSRGYTSLQLQYHREAMERRRRAMPALVAVKKPKAVAKPKPVCMIPELDLPPLPLNAVNRLDMLVDRYRTKIAAMTASYAEAVNEGRKARRPGPSIADIKHIVAAKYEVTIAEILSPKRDRILVRPRQVAYYLSKQLTQRSLPEIGQAFANRDHTSILSGCKKIVELLAAGDEALAEKIDALMQILAVEWFPRPVKQPAAVGPTWRELRNRGIAAKVLTAMQSGASTATEVARALDMTNVQCVTGAIAGMVRSGKIVHVRKERGRKPDGRKHEYYVYAVAESQP